MRIRIPINKLVVCSLAALLLTNTAWAFVLGPTVPGKWGAPCHPCSGGTVTWSLMPTGADLSLIGGGTSTALADFMPAGFHDELVSAFDAWSTVADIRFLEVVDGGGPFDLEPVANIRLGGRVLDGPLGLLAFGFYPPQNGLYAAGDIHFDIADNWKLGFGGPGFSIFQVAAHEIGHAIGLDHTFVLQSLMNPFYTETFGGPQADDIAGAQFLYGPARAVVPEPATVSLLLVGAVILGCRRRGSGWLANPLAHGIMRGDSLCARSSIG